MLFLYTPKAANKWASVSSVILSIKFFSFLYTRERTTFLSYLWPLKIPDKGIITYPILYTDRLSVTD